MTRRRVRLDLAYDGTDFAGWQIQPGVETVQGTLERALSRLMGGRKARLRAAGRTDAGVHARQQVADGLVTTRLDDRELLRALDAILPEEIRPRGLWTVPDTFHSRHDAVCKTYRYVIDRSRRGDPFLARFALHHPSGLDRASIADALRRLPGRKDWAGFAGAGGEVQRTVREMTEAGYTESSDGLGVFTFGADGFLNHMVRNLVGTLLEVGRGRFGPDRIDEILASGDRTLAGPTAPPRGLFLDRVDYPGQKPAGRLEPTWAPWRRCYDGPD